MRAHIAKKKLNHQFQCQCGRSYQQVDKIPVLLVEGSKQEKANVIELYNQVNQEYVSSGLGRFITNMNFGYEPVSSHEDRSRLICKNKINQASQRLVYELLEQDVIQGKIILDAGCGRCGTVKLLKQLYRGNQNTYLGTDICVEGLRYANLEDTVLFVADIECLPILSHSVDIIFNVEVLHNLASYERCFREYRRVISGQGILYIADLFTQDQYVNLKKSSIDGGFICERERDITVNVIRSNQIISFNRLAIHNNSDEWIERMEAPGSQLHQQFEDRELTYRLLKMSCVEQ